MDTLHHIDPARDAIIVELNTRRARRVNAGVDLLLALALAAAGAWALLAYFEPCADMALCALAALPTRPGLLHRALLRLRGAYLRARIRSAQQDLEFQDQALTIAEWETEHIPRARQATRLHIEALALQLRDIDLATRSE